MTIGKDLDNVYHRSGSLCSKTIAGHRETCG